MLSVFASPASRDQIQYGAFTTDSPVLPPAVDAVERNACALYAETDHTGQSANTSSAVPLGATLTYTAFQPFDSVIVCSTCGPAPKTGAKHAATEAASAETPIFDRVFICSFPRKCAYSLSFSGLP